MSLKEDVRKKLGKSQLNTLHPPVAPKQRESEKELAPIRIGGDGCETSYSNSERGAPTHSKLSLDFSYLTNNSSFQRAIIEFIKKFIPGFEDVKPRGSKEVMVKTFNKNIANYRECMQELEEKLRGKRIE